MADSPYSVCMKNAKKCSGNNNSVSKVSEVRKCLEGNTMSNPVHTSVTRMCGDYDSLFHILPGGQYIAEVA